MGAAADSYADLGVGDSDACGSVEKASKDLFGFGGLKSGEALGKASVECVGYQGEHQVKIDLDGDGGTQGVPAAVPGASRPRTLPARCGPHSRRRLCHTQAGKMPAIQPARTLALQRERPPRASPATQLPCPFQARGCPPTGAAVPHSGWQDADDTTIGASVRSSRRLVIAGCSPRP